MLARRSVPIPIPRAIEAIMASRSNFIHVQTVAGECGRGTMSKFFYSKSLSLEQCNAMQVLIRAYKAWLSYGPSVNLFFEAPCTYLDTST